MNLSKEEKLIRDGRYGKLIIDLDDIFILNKFKNNIFPRSFVTQYSNLRFFCIMCTSDLFSVVKNGNIPYYKIEKGTLNVKKIDNYNI